MKMIYILMLMLIPFVLAKVVEVNPREPVYTDEINNFTELNYFSSALVTGNTASTIPGIIRFTGTQFQGWNGTGWVAFGAGGGGADTTCEDSACNLSDDVGYRFDALAFNGTSGFDDLTDDDTTYTSLSEFVDDLGHVEDNRSWNETKADGKYSLIGSAAGLSRFVNYTPIKTTGNITNGSLNGYLAASAICDAYYDGTHICHMAEIVHHISTNQSLVNFTATFRVSEGAPGYLADANDCGGWQGQSGTALGSIWVGNAADGGSGSLVACNAERAIGCCG